MHLIYFILVSLFGAQGPIDPVSWEFSLVQDEDGQEFVVMLATIDETWAVYSQFTGEGGPVATEFKFDTQKGLELIGTVLEKGELIEIHSSLFDIKVSKFENRVKFVQQIQRDSKLKSVKGSITFMTCNGQQCLAPKEVPFEVRPQL